MQGGRQMVGFNAMKNFNSTPSLSCSPVEAGAKQIVIRIDFSRFGRIIGLLSNDRPYQLHYKLTDTDTNKARSCSHQNGKSSTYSLLLSVDVHSRSSSRAHEISRLNLAHKQTLQKQFV